VVKSQDQSSKYCHI